MKIFKVILTLVFFLYSGISQAQFKYKEIPQSYLNQSTKNVVLESEKGFVDITSFLPADYKKDGSIDYTSYIQKGLNAHRKVIMPDFDVLINDNGLNLKSNSVIYFPKHSRLIMAPSARGAHSNDHYDILHINNKKNIKIYNPTLIGDRDHHNGTKGEWGMGIGIRSSTNIEILNADIKKCWGDAIYIGSTGQKTSPSDRFYIPSENIKIRYGVIDQVRRNGISITNGRNIEVSNIVIANTNGALPMSGLDIEPNSSADIIDDIIVSNLTTFNIYQDGILLVLTRLPSVKFSNKTNITINNHLDNGSYSGMRIGSGFRKNDLTLSGRILVQNSKWLNTKRGLRFRSGRNLLPKIEYKNLKMEGTTNETVNDIEDIYLNGRTISEIKNKVKDIKNIVLN